jgi:hypothetical protein
MCHDAKDHISFGKFRDWAEMEEWGVNMAKAEKSGEQEGHRPCAE